jgi:hypothetical protein
VEQSGYAVERTTVRQKKTGRPVRFELTEQTRQAVDDYIKSSWQETGKIIGQKPPLRPKHVWSIRARLQIEGRTRDLAMFNLAIDSKLRGCDVVALRVEDVAPSGDPVQ